MEKSQDLWINVQTVCAVCARRLSVELPNLDYGDDRIKDGAVLKDYCGRCEFLHEILYCGEEKIEYGAALILRHLRKVGEVVWSDYRI